MPRCKVLNVSRPRQRELNLQFPWLIDIQEDTVKDDLQRLAISTFDHWLTRDEANQLLENVPAIEHARRESLLAGFCASLIADTEVLSFTQRGRGKNAFIFRSFTSVNHLANYCKPHGGEIFRHWRHRKGPRHFHVVLPEYDCAFYEGWDYTYGFYFTKPTVLEIAQQWAQQNDVHLLVSK